MADHYDENPAKRKRLSDCRSSSIETSSSNLRAGSKTHLSRINGNAESSGKDPGISIASNSKLASQTIAPFLIKHIPQQYAPQGSMEKSKNPGNKDPNTKYCYRHRPDLKCRRQVDEPSMDQLQKELETLSQSDQQGIAHVWALFSAAPSKHRNLMLKGILAQCCFPQLSLLSHSVRELTRIDYLSALPPELGFKILCYLDTTSLCKAAQVSRNWRSLADDNVVWHRMCEQHIDRKCTKCGWGLPLLEQKRLRASKRQIQLRATGRGINTWSPNITPLSEYSPRDTPSEDRDLNVKEEREFETSHKTVLNVNSSTEDSKGSYFPQRFRPWKDVYKDRFKVGSNWKHGRYSTKIFKGHTNGVMCLQFNDQVLATGSYDTTIKIWDLETGKELRTLRSHTLGIRCLQFDDNKLISGSLDKTLKVWNWRTGECIRTLTGHSAGVISLHFVSTLLVSGSIDKTVRVWNFEEKSSCVLRGHEDWVNAVKIDLPSRTIFSASDDLTVRLWDLDTKTVIKSYKGHVGLVQQVLPLPPEFEIEDMDAEPQDSGDDSASTISGPEVAARDVSRSTHLPSTFGPLFEDGTRPLPPRYMLTSALDSTVRLWDVATGKSLRTFFGHVEGVWALAADTLRVVSGAEDKMVKVWDARSGKCERTFYCHAGPVTCIGLSDSRLCTGSEDCEVRMLSFKTEGLGDATHEEGMGRSDGRIDTLA